MQLDHIFDTESDSNEVEIDSDLVRKSALIQAIKEINCESCLANRIGYACKNCSIDELKKFIKNFKNTAK